MIRTSTPALASLRYRRPYWMLFLRGVDNWRIYTKMHQPEHQRHEMLYQAWLGGLDRPYTRPKCMAHQPSWLAKKRHLMRKPKLDGAETALEKYVLEWHKRFLSFQGTVRPTPDDLHAAFDLVERPLDLSYASQLLNRCRNVNNIRFDKETFLIYVEACLRVDRKDVAQFALENADKLGFWYVDPNVAKYLRGEQTWYKRSNVDGLYYPLNENEAANATQKSKTAAAGAAQGAAAATTAASGATTIEDEEAELLRLQAELEALERGE